MRDADADDELPPVIGERYRDVLAERAIALLADWDEPIPPNRLCGPVSASAVEGPHSYPNATGGERGRN